MSLKDANDYLQAGKQVDFLSAFWSAAAYSPEGILYNEDIWNELSRFKESRVAKAYKYPWEGLNEATLGLRKGELVMLTGGSGVAKTTFAMEIHRSLMMNDKEKVAGMYLEANAGLVLLDMLSPIIGTNLRRDIKFNEEEQRKIFDANFRDYLYLMQNNWHGDYATIERNIRYYASMGCSFVILDHISRLVSGVDNGDERKALDYISHSLKALTEELDVGIIAVSHLRRPDGKAHEEGGQTHLSQLRGSAGIAQLSDIVIGFERNGQAEDDMEKNTTTMRILKNRWLGDLGKACDVFYEKETTRLIELHEQGGEE